MNEDEVKTLLESVTKFLSEYVKHVQLNAMVETKIVEELADIREELHKLNKNLTQEYDDGR